MKIQNNNLFFKGQVITDKKTIAENILISNPYQSEIIDIFNFINQDIKYSTPNDRDFRLSYNAKSSADLLFGEFCALDLDTNKLYRSSFQVPKNPVNNEVLPVNEIIKSALRLTKSIISGTKKEDVKSKNPQTQAILDKLI